MKTNDTEFRCPYCNQWTDTFMEKKKIYNLVRCNDKDNCGKTSIISQITTVYEGIHMSKVEFSGYDIRDDKQSIFHSVRFLVVKP
jgi:transcription elongation factor Elf1